MGDEGREGLPQFFRPGGVGFLTGQAVQVDEIVKSDAVTGGYGAVKAFLLPDGDIPLIIGAQSTGFSAC